MTAEAKRTNSKSSWSTAGLALAAALALLLLSGAGRFRVDAAERLELFLGENLLDGRLVFRREVGVLVELGLQPLHFLELVDEGARASSPLRLGTASGLRFEASATS